MKDQEKEGRIVAAICAGWSNTNHYYPLNSDIYSNFIAPTAFKAHSIGKGKSITSYPAFKEQLAGDYNYVEDRVIVDGKIEFSSVKKKPYKWSSMIYVGNFTTSRGPGTAFEFALSLVEQLSGKEVSETLANQMLLKF